MNDKPIETPEEAAENSAGGLIDAERYEHIAGFISGANWKETQLREAPKDVDGWISIEQEYPRYYQSVIVFCLNTPNQVIAWYASNGDDGFFTIYGTDVIINDVTHWMPLPAPPNQTKTQHAHSESDRLRADNQALREEIRLMKIVNEHP